MRNPKKVFNFEYLIGLNWFSHIFALNPNQWSYKVTQLLFQSCRIILKHYSCELDRGSAVLFQCRLLVQICNLVAPLVWILCTSTRREYLVTNSKINNLLNNSSSIRVMIEHIQDLFHNCNLLKFDVQFCCPLFSLKF